MSRVNEGEGRSIRSNDVDFEVSSRLLIGLYSARNLEVVTSAFMFVKEDRELAMSEGTVLIVF